MQKFVDVSNNNGPHVDFAAIKRDGAVGVYLKVTEGTGFVDPDYASNYARAKAAGLKVGGYHFGHPKDSALQELGFFLSHLKLEPGDLKPALDLEKQEVAWAGVNRYALTFLGGLEHHIGERGVLYCGEYFMRSAGLLDVPERKWVPSYGAKPWAHFDAWQFSDGLPQYPGAIDHLDTSITTSIDLFVYKAPVHRRATAASLRRIRGGFYAFREWREGIGRWHGWRGARKALRPRLPRRIPSAWWARLKAMRK